MIPFTPARDIQRNEQQLTAVAQTARRRLFADAPPLSGRLVFSASNALSNPETISLRNRFPNAEKYLPYSSLHIQNAMNAGGLFIIVNGTYASPADIPENSPFPVFFVDRGSAISVSDLIIDYVTLLTVTTTGTDTGTVAFTFRRGRVEQLTVAN